MKEKLVKIIGKLDKKKIISIVVVIALIGCSVGGYTIYQNLNKGEAQATLDMASLYQDEIVTVSDIVVGVSETGTASLVYEEIDLDAGYEVTETIAVAGVYVEEGDILATIDLEASDLEDTDALDTLEDAEDALAKLQVETEAKLIEAQSVYDSAVTTGENAESVYSLEMDEISDGLSDLNSQIDDIEDEIDDLESQVKNGLDDDYDLSTLNKALAALETEISEAEANGEDTTQLNEEYSAKESEIEQAQAQYDTEYNQLPDQIDELEDQLSSLETSKAKYKTTMDGLEVAAESEYNSSVNTYSNAYTTYTLTVKELNDALEEAEELVEELTDALESEDEESEAIVIDEEGNLLAPCSGYIMSVSEPTSITVDENTIESGLSITVSDGDYAQIDISVSQDDIADIYIGMEANVVFDAYEEVLITSEVSSLSLTPSGDMTSSVNYTVTVICDIPQDEDMTIFSSMTATVTFVEAQSNDVLAISTNYIIYEDGYSYVYLESADGTVELVEVTTGFSDGFDVEIISGLEEGDIVINESAVIDLEN